MSWVELHGSHLAFWSLLRLFPASDADSSQGAAWWPYRFCSARSDHHRPTCIAAKQHRLPPSLVPHWIQVLFPCDGLYPNPMQVPKLGSKMSQHWTSICLIQALGFPCSVCHRVTELCSGCSALQRDLKIYPPMRNSVGEQGKISPSAFYFGEEAQGERVLQLSSYTLVHRDGLCGEERDCNELEGMNGIYQVLYPGCSIDLYLLRKGEKNTDSCVGWAGTSSCCQLANSLGITAWGLIAFVICKCRC